MAGADHLKSPVCICTRWGWAKGAADSAAVGFTYVQFASERCRAVGWGSGSGGGDDGCVFPPNA